MGQSRQFGVEIECGFPSSLAGLRKHLAKGHAEGKIGAWHHNLTHDGTMAEVRVGPLKGIKGLSELRAVMDYIRDNGGYVTGEDGLHVHFDAEEFYSEGVFKYIGHKPNDQSDILIESWFNNQPLIRELVNESRHDNWACSGWGRLAVDSFKKTKAPGRHEIHMAIGHKTIEIRLLQGTLDPDLATSWVRFGLAFIRESANRTEPLPTQPSVADLLRVIRTPVKAREYLTTYDKSEYDVDDYYEDGY